MKNQNIIKTPQQYHRKLDYRSPYLSPSNTHQNYSSTDAQLKSDPFQRKSPDNFMIKYPFSSKFQLKRQQQLTHQVYRQNKQFSPRKFPDDVQYFENKDDKLKILQQQNIINQLKAALQSSTSQQKKLQQQMYAQKSKNYELLDVKRRLQQQISRMQFQLDRIGNYEMLQYKEAFIKLENSSRENIRLSAQVTQLMEQVKNLKKDQRKLMTENDTLLKDNQILARQNQNLIDQLSIVDQEFNQLKKELQIITEQKNMNSQNIHQKYKITHSMKNIPTDRTHLLPSMHINPPKSPSKSFKLAELKEQNYDVDYQQQNQKLMQDYEKLMLENQSMKLLYQQFYKKQSQTKQQINKNREKGHNFHQQSSIQKQINKNSDKKVQNRKHSFVNEFLAQNIQKQQTKKIQNFEKAQEQMKMMLKTNQRQYVAQQIRQIRQEVIDQLINKCYLKSIKRSQNQHKNSLKLFIEEFQKHFQIFYKMAENYLQIRTTIKEQANYIIPKKYEQIKIMNPNQKWVDKIYKSIKQNVKKDQKSVGYHLALFRLLTLISKVQNINPDILENIKHTTLKYIYKIEEERANGKIK